MSAGLLPACYSNAAEPGESVADIARADGVVFMPADAEHQCSETCAGLDPRVAGSEGGQDCLLESDLTVRVLVVNCGDSVIETGFNVAFYAGDPEVGGVLAGTNEVPEGLGPGEATWVGWNLPWDQSAELPSAPSPAPGLEVPGIDAFFRIDPRHDLEECSEWQPDSMRVGC